MSAKPEKEDDRKDSLRQILSRRGSSLISELLAIQRHAGPVKKAHGWAANLRCILYLKSSPTSLRLIHNRNLSRDFIAISWTWKPSDHENAAYGKYSLTSPTFPKSRKLDVRNVVLDRIVKYLVYTDIDIFWMDQICINQSSDAQKAKAMNSMDLVYRNAKRSLGLLTTPIRTGKCLRLVQLLLSGQMSYKNEDSYYMFQRGTKYSDIICLLQVIHNLTKDPWWMRSWIYQEEYISGFRMDLLIPISSKVHPALYTSPVAGEFVVGASNFRKHATIFLLAYYSTGWRSYRASCHHMLDIIGKYNILLPRSGDGPVCMSARILADIGKRNTTKPWDVIAITANTCGHDTRRKRSSLVKVKQSLSLCLLALFLLNGEVTGTCLDANERRRRPPRC